MDKQEKRFVACIRAYYSAHGRHTLPWRKTKDPYRILVSEIMLQQTQVDRVIPKYHSFLKRFPTIESLARARLGDVLGEWQGLGYNRRAKMLHLCAQALRKEYGGVFPKTYAELIALPGVGAYTAGAVLAFAFGKAIPIIETNIRTVFIHHFFNDDLDVHDRDILHMVTKTLDERDPRTWYYALMDYGSHIKKTYGNPNGRSKHYTKQSTFKGSDRQIRGMILKHLLQKQYTREALHDALPFEEDRIDVQIERLLEERLIVRRGTQYTLP